MEHVTPQAAVSRAGMYRFLSAVYLGSPSTNLLRVLADVRFLDEVGVLFGDAAATELAAALLARDPEETRSEISRDHTDLFALPTGRSVMPFEDVYRGETDDRDVRRGPLLGPRAIEVRQMYREAGAELDPACKELPTHVGIELAFMRVLCEREAAAEQQGLAMDARRHRELQHRFLQQHVNAWVPDLCRRIRANAVTSFYRGIAHLTEAFLVRETASLAPEVPKRGRREAPLASGRPG